MATKVDSVERLREEYKAWQRVHPKDFIAKPLEEEDGSIEWLTWKCAIPGPAKTPWEGGLFPLRLEFPQNYPFSPPKCIFTPTILHPNVFPSGTVCLSLLDKDWQPQITMKQVLQGIQLLLQDPNFHDPAQAEAFMVYSQSSLDYENRVKAFAKKMNPATNAALRDFNIISA